MMIFFAICLVLIPYCSGTDQSVTFYESEDCKGRNETLTGNHFNLNDTWVGNAMSAKIVGLNVFTLYNDGNKLWKVIFFDTQPTNDRCKNKEEMIGGSDDHTEFHFQEIRRVGPSSLSKDSITLATEKFFGGLNFTFDTSGLHELNNGPHFMLNVTIFGSRPWLLYPLQEGAGAKTCICPTHLNGDGFTLWQTGGSVGSVKMASDEECPCEQATTTSTTKSTTPNTESTTPTALPSTDPGVETTTTNCPCRCDQGDSSGVMHKLSTYLGLIGILVSFKNLFKM